MIVIKEVCISPETCCWDTVLLSKSEIPYIKLSFLLIDIETYKLCGNDQWDTCYQTALQRYPKHIDILSNVMS